MKKMNQFEKLTKEELLIIKGGATSGITDPEIANKASTITDPEMQDRVSSITDPEMQDSIGIISLNTSTSKKKTIV